MRRDVETSLREVKAAAGSLVGYVERYVRLERRGGRHPKASCPFHREKTPSFHVYGDHFHCFGCGAHGDVIDFLSRIEGRPVGEVVRDLRVEGGIANGPSPEATRRIEEHRKAADALADEPDPYELICPVPSNTPALWGGEGFPTAPILRPGAPLGEALRLQLPVDELHVCLGYRGELLGYVVRTPRNRAGRKGTYQVGWSRNVRLADGSLAEGWSFVSFPHPRAIYGAQLVGQAREEGRPLRYLIVEGEKCQERGARHVGADWIVVSWVGGGRAWHHTDWSLIAEGEEVVLWPDADESGEGRRTMTAIGEHLAALGCRSIRWVEPAPGCPDGWDLADAVDHDGWNAQRLLSVVEGANPWMPPAAVHEPVQGAEEVEGRLPPGLPPRPPARDKILSAEENAALARFTRRVRHFRAVVEAPPPTLQFTLPGFLRGTVGLVVGAGGSGKSFAMLQSMISLAAGLDIWSLWSDQPDRIASLPAPPGRCVYVAAEDPEEIVDWRTHHLGVDAAVRLDAFGLDAGEVMERIDQNLRIVPVYGQGRDNALAVAQGRTDAAVVPGPLYECLVQVGFGALVIALDTLGRVASTLEEREGGDMGQVIDICEALTVDTGRANVWLAHHINKASAVNGQAQEQQAVSGSRKLTDHCRWQANMATMDARDGERRGLTDEERRRWIGVAAAKLNYAENSGARWWRRGDHGILVGGNRPPECERTERGEPAHAVKSTRAIREVARG